MSTALHIIGYCLAGAFVLCGIAAVWMICAHLNRNGRDDPDGN